MSASDICYVILLHKVPGRETPAESTTRHINYIRALDDQGILVLAGPFEDFPGGMVIVRADSIEAAREIALRDPFILDGVRTFEVRSWHLANRANGYLST